VNARTTDGDSPLITAACNGHSQNVGIANILLNAGAYESVTPDPVAQPAASAVSRPALSPPSSAPAGKINEQSQGRYLAMSERPLVNG
jgi:hypothetical protein